MAESPGVYSRAHQYKWLRARGSSGYTSGTLAAEKAPLEGIVYYNYEGQTDFSFEGTTARATKVGRVLDDGTSQVQQFEYNPYGHVVRSVDPLGRETSYIFDQEPTSPGYLTDLKEIRQKTGPNAADFEVLAKVSYDSRHLPLSVTDAAGQPTTFTYNTAGQVRTATNAKGELTTFWYHPTGQPGLGEPLDPAATGYLIALDGPALGASDSTRFTFDGFGRPRTTTDSEGYVVTMDYDGFDRPTLVSFPDGTYNQLVYERLDLTKSRDRRGRWTTFAYNALRQRVSSRDPAGQLTQFDWCACGALHQIIDPAGKATMWTYDRQGRVISKTYADNTKQTYSYEPSTSRLLSTTDAKSQVTTYQYYLDNALKQVAYSNAAVATPTVSFTYDTFYRRVTSMTDGLGATIYSYNPIPVAPTLSAGKLASVTGPLANSTVAFTYDELGRTLSTSINGAANTMTARYDTLGRIDRTTSLLGTFDYAYVGVTGRLQRVDLPNGQKTFFEYHPNTAPTGTGNGDQRLREIRNLTPSGATLSTHGYTYDMNGLIQTWSQQIDASPAVTASFEYDNANQLVGALMPVGYSSTLKSHRYRYDSAGNRTSEQIDNRITSASHNTVNQLTSIAPSGPVRVSGTVSEASSVTVNGVAATVDSGNTFSADVPLSPGTQTLSVVAKDPSNNTATRNYQYTVANGTGRTLSYDANGNLINDGAGKTYDYDAVNRLVKITQASGITEFAYNGAGERVQEKLNGTLIKQWIWAGGTQPSEERDASNNVTKRFFGSGQQIAGANYYYATDHLGSVREMTNASGAVRARYQYDPYGRQTKVSGDLESDFGFTGHYRHQASGLSLTHFRAYEPNTGRWTTRDPISENGGLNLYAYCANDPINYMDPLGKVRWGQFAKGIAVFTGGLVAVAVAATSVGVSGGLSAPVAALLALNGAAAITYGLGNIVAAFAPDAAQAQKMAEAPQSAIQAAARLVGGKELQDLVGIGESTINICGGIANNVTKLEKVQQWVEGADNMKSVIETARDSINNAGNPSPPTPIPTPPNPVPTPVPPAK